MADVHSKEVRSYNMSRIKGKNTKPELIVRSFLHRSGFRFRLHSIDLPGKPDIVLKKYKTVIFVHGCFWHGHTGCKYFVVPKTRTEWWENKIEQTKLRDKTNYTKMKESGYQVIIIWECQLKSKERDKTLSKLLKRIRNLM